MTTARATGTTTDPPGGVLGGRTAPRARALLGSTRLRLAGAIVGVMVGATLLGVLAMRALIDDQLEARISTALEQESMEFRGFMADAEQGLLAAGRDYLARNVLDQGEAIAIVRDGVGVVYSVGAPYRLAENPALRREWEGLDEASLTTVPTPVGRAMVLAVPVLQGEPERRTGTFVVANFMSQERAESDAVFRVAVQVALGAILLVALLAWSIAGRVLRPLGLVTETARRISEEDVTRRLPARAGDDEMSDLVRTFNGMLDRLERALTTQREFLADAGHELRTPLAIVRGHVEQLGAGIVPAEDVPETLALVADEVRRMSRLVDDLLSLAQSEQPDFLALAPVDLGDLADQLHRRALSFEGPAWRCAPAAGVIRADQERLVQAGLNLITNAARHTPPGGEVVIGTSLEGGLARIWVEDSGPGVPPELAERVLDRRVRGVGRRDGLGLGLAITRAVALAHGGRVEVAAGAAGGARITIVVPEEGPG